MHMANNRATVMHLSPVLASESLYVGIDIGKRSHVAGFVSTTLLKRHGRFEACPVLKFEQSREGFRSLADRIRQYIPLEQCFVLLEYTGHYQQALVQYLLELDLSVYLMHVQKRPRGLIKTDKRDALGLAHQLYNQLELGAQPTDKAQFVRRAIPPTPAAMLLRSLTRHRHELVHETTQRKNKLTAICDELFPELTHVCHDPNAPSALVMREHFPTPQALAAASFVALCAVRESTHPSNQKLAELQLLAAHSIGTRATGRQRGLILEQTQLIHELRLLQTHIAELETEISHAVEQSREGQILLSIPGVGPIIAATLISAIGHIDNFPSAASLKSYLGWAPAVAQTGTTLDTARLKHGGRAVAREQVYMMVCNAIRLNTEWAQLYARLVPRKCNYDERSKTYKGKGKVIGRIAGQMISLIYALLRRDAELVQSVPAARSTPPPALYDPTLHKSHREGKYRSQKPSARSSTVLLLPLHQSDLL
jgi:transposase